MGLSDEDKRQVLSDLKEYMEQGLLCPEVKPSLIGACPEDFASNRLTFGGNPLPEFVSISRNLLDCFAVAVLSIPSVKIPRTHVILRCKMHEDDGTLMLYLSAVSSSGKSMLPLELTTDGEVWVATYLRLLSPTKSISLGNIYWNRSGPHSFFFFPYPGRLVRARVPGLGDPGEDGKARWPECELVLKEVTAAMQDTARNTAKLADTDQSGMVQ